jgi:2-oxoacid:acceptor oxidoreductase delta subunit (pyruvate/2-ketoisovalerate family)
MTGKPFAITLNPDSSRANHTGSWRTERPVYLDRRPPCSQACPAGEQVQTWLYQAEGGSYLQAWQEIVAVNPFPAVMGRVCYHPCETSCNRAQLDEAVGINSVERFLGDEALRQGWQLPAPGADTGRRVLVVGAGPAGLSAAYQLRLQGHAVRVVDRAAQAGGMMRYGIPAFRLPRDVLDAELGRLLELGIELRLGETVTDLAGLLDQEDFDAAFVAVGAQLSHRAYIPAGQSARVLDALSLLAAVSAGERPELGRQVIVYGGGNTAMDVARTARRLGAEEALVVYRRTKDRMPAEPVEVEQALGEGVRVRWLSTIAEVQDGRLTVERMEIGPDGVPRSTGELAELPGDCVVLALGQDVDHRLVDGLSGVDFADGRLQVDATLMTGQPGVFAGGDLIGRVGSVTSAIGQGRQAARSIAAWLEQRPPAVEPVAEPASFDLLNPWYYSDAPKSIQPVLAAARRTADFSEVVGGLDASTALYEARRCMSCGNCFGCDNCYGMCPDNAIHKVAEGHGYAIDYDYCKGCGICASECPCGAIAMQPETI